MKDLSIDAQVWSIVVLTHENRVQSLNWVAGATYFAFSDPRMVGRMGFFFIVSYFGGWGGGWILPVDCNNLKMDIWSLRLSDCNNIIMISQIS